MNIRREKHDDCGERPRTAAEIEGARAERERWKAVIASPEAKHKYRTAIHILTNTDLSVDAVRDLLASLGQGNA